MSGNITDQMCSGIDRTQAVLVFVTKNYVNKVAAFKPLEQLTKVELERWLKSIELSSLVPNLKEHDVNGEMLALCETVEEIMELGCKTVQAKLLLRKVQEAKTSGGVSLSLLSDCTPASASPAVPATALPVQGPAPASVPAAPVTAPLTVPPAAAIPAVPPIPRPSDKHSAPAPKAVASPRTVPEAAAPVLVPAVPPIPRPSDKQFVDYAKEGHRDQVTEALRYYPDLIGVQSE
eukprot:gene36290-biopygen587